MAFKRGRRAKRKSAARRRALAERRARRRRRAEEAAAYEPSRRYGTDGGYDQLSRRYGADGSYAQPAGRYGAASSYAQPSRRYGADGGYSQAAYRSRYGRDAQERYEERYEDAYPPRRRRRSARPRRMFRFSLSWKRVGEGYCDYNLLMVVIFLLCFGLIMLYSTTYYLSQLEYEGDSFHYLKRQGLISLGGLAGMYVVSKIPYQLWKKLAWLGYCAAAVSVILLLTPLGRESNGATRWLGVTEAISFQPAELCKLALIVFIPYVVTQVGRNVRTLKCSLLLLTLGGFLSGLILVISRNLSSALILLGITVVILYIVHPKTWPFLAVGGAGLASVWAFIHFVVRNMDTSTNYRLRRIIGWLNPEEYASDLTYQTMQALYAIGSGGLFGKGLGNSAQKMILPEAQNDMIFSIICEELGIFGVAIVLFLFAILLYRLMFIARNAADLYGSLVATGIFAHIAIQVILNIAVVTNVIPNTGITLPFISYGGTSIVFLMAEMGLALNISRSIKWKKD